MLVCAPTGAGKTVVGEFAVWAALQRGTEVLLHDPAEGAVQPEVRRLHRPARRRERRAAHRRQLDQRRSAGRGHDDRGAPQHDLRAVADAERARATSCMDEVHYLKDQYRGAVWEEILIQLDEKVQVACALGDRVERRGVRRVAVDRARQHRRDHHREPAGAARALADGRRQAASAVHPRGRRAEAEPGVATARPSRAARQNRDFRRGRRPDAPDWCPTATDVVERLRGEGMLPGIYFIFSRAGCDQSVRLCLRGGRPARRRRTSASGSASTSRCERPCSPSRITRSSATTTGSRARPAASRRTTPG